MSNFPDSKPKWQLPLILGVGFAIIILGTSSFLSSQKSLKLTKEVNVATSQFSGIIDSQQDLLLYELRLNQWIHGDIPRQDVQAARNILIRRLDATGPTGISLAQLAVPGFLTDLRNADTMIAQAPEGYLPDLMQNQYRNQANQILSAIESEGNKLISDYANTIAEYIGKYTIVQRKSVLINFYLQLASRILAVIFIVIFTTRYLRRGKQRKIQFERTQKSLDEVRANLTTAHEAVESLREENEKQSEIVSTVNHELRTPLTSIIGYIDILKDFPVTKDNKEFHQFLAVMDRNASQLLDMIEDILSLSALNSQKVLTKSDNVDLVDTCERCVSDLLIQIEEANINLSANYDLRESYTVHGNSPLLSRVFTNLISNAIKFSPKNSRMDISFSRTKSEKLGATVRIEVKDQGIGIPEKEIDQLFSSYFRASNALQKNIPGSGLGLAIVKRIIGLHGGEISVKSTLGEGTTIIVDLPLGVSPVEAMVMSERQSVLERAIEALSQSSVEGLAETAHDVGGAIGFYTFLVESIEVLDLSRWLEENPDAEEGIVLYKRNALLDSLNIALARIKEEVIS